MFTPVQIILIWVSVHLISAFSTNTQMIVKFGGQQVVRAFIVGLILGDPTTGLLIGGTLQLMAMGLAGYGGASIPDYNAAAVVGTAFAIASKAEDPVAMALAIGLPVAALGLQLDIVAKTVNSFWYHLVEKAVKNRNYKLGYRITIFGEYFFGRQVLKVSYPTLLFLLFGEPVVNAITTYMPANVMAAISSLSGVLPALGMAILMIYMPVKSYAWCLILGFVLYKFMGLAILPITLLGAVVAVLVYQSLEKERTMNELMLNAGSAGGIGDE